MEALRNLKDLSKKITLKSKEFTHAICLLALQNLQDPSHLFETAYNHLQKGSLFIFVINHPCFRIPRQSSWETDAAKKWIYRRVDRYMSPMQIPIQTNPGQKGSKTTLSFHHPLSFYLNKCTQSGFLIKKVNELLSDKQSTGKKAKMENASRKEFPLFLTIKAVKI